MAELVEAKGREARTRRPMALEIKEGAGGIGRHMSGQPEKEPEGSFDPKLVQRLRSKKEAERKAAEEELRRLGPGAVDELLRLLDKESANRQRRRRMGYGFLVLWLVFVVGMAALDGGKNIGSFTGMIGSMLALFAATQAQKDAANVLSRYDDIRIVGALAEALSYDDKGLTKTASDALIRLLPKLRASDHALLSSDQRRHLDKALAQGKNRELAMAILDAYEQVGDRTSVSLLEKIAAGEVRAVRNQAIRERAAEVLPAVRSCAELVSAAQTLLRPTVNADEDVLVRPAGGPTDYDDETLLRPVEQPDGADRIDAATSRTPGNGNDEAAATLRG